jgi:hypothetical protein
VFIQALYNLPEMLKTFKTGNMFVHSTLVLSMTAVRKVL